jgi:hypothetical protein
MLWKILAGMHREGATSASVVALSHGRKSVLQSYAEKHLPEYQWVCCENASECPHDSRIVSDRSKRHRMTLGKKETSDAG